MTTSKLRWPHPNWREVRSLRWCSGGFLAYKFSVPQGVAQYKQTCLWFIGYSTKIAKICQHLAGSDMLNLQLWCSKCISPHRRDVVPAHMRCSNHKDDLVTAELRIVYCLIHRVHTEEHSLHGNKYVSLSHNEQRQWSITSSIFDAGIKDENEKLRYFFPMENMNLYFHYDSILYWPLTSVLLS